MQRTHKVLTEPLMGSSLYDAELEVESDSAERGIERYYNNMRESIARGQGASLKAAERLILYWVDDLTEGIEWEQNQCRAGVPGFGRTSYGPALVSFDARHLAYVSMYHGVSQVMETPGGQTFTKTANRVGRAILADFKMDELRRIDREQKKATGKSPGLVVKLQHRWKNLSPEAVLQYARQVRDSDAAELRATVHLGSFLLFFVASRCRLPLPDNTTYPAFIVRTRTEGTKQRLYWEIEPRAYEILEDGHSHRAKMRPRYSFMVVPPMPWVQDGDVPGGYLRNRTPLVARPWRRHKELIARTDMTRPYGLLQNLQGHAFCLNHKQLAVVDQLERDGEIGPDMPEPKNIDMPPRLPVTATEDEIKARKAQRSRIYKENVRRVSARRAFGHMMAEARRFVGKPTIYQPHQMCFRSRCYPLPSAINHHGPDIARSMFLFAHPCEKSERSDYWLMIHAANTYGVNKLPYKERAEWARDNLKEMALIAKDPIANRGWYKADKPWQFLAACTALFNDDIGVRLPYQADGTCNGLQHYTAMGLDAGGAALVNLVDGARPSDIYTAVLERVLPVVEEDARDTTGRRMPDKYDKTPGKLVRNVASGLLPRLKRSVVKQPVMTVIYGVTAYGATDQLYSALLDGEDGAEIASDESKYLVKIVMRAIGELLEGAKHIMDWLRTLAGLTAIEGHFVEWTTPIGFPAVQPYCDTSSEAIRTVAGILNIPSVVTGPKVGKQTSAFAPNYIHGVDAAHMLMTCERMTQENRPFAGIHDAFLTTTGNADALHSHLRETFAALHSRNLMAELHDQFSRLHPTIEYPEPPERGLLDINEVITATYAFH